MVNQSEAYEPQATRSQSDHYAQVLTDEEDEEIPETTTIPTAWLLKLFSAVQDLTKLFPPLLFSPLQNGESGEVQLSEVDQEGEEIDDCN